jgi:carbamoyltransferase
LDEPLRVRGWQGGASRRLKQVSAVASRDENLVLSGGAALNIHANSIIRSEIAPRRMFVPPFCCDSGQALGALLYFMNVELGVRPRVDLPFLGMGKADLPSELDERISDQVVEDLLEDRVVAWHWGRAEIGPRALGLELPRSGGHVVVTDQAARVAA